MEFQDYIRFSRLFLRQKGVFPVYLLFFVTSRCSCRCKHCFYWKSTNKPYTELTLSEIEKISASMDRLLQVTLTGGDAALREDLADIAHIFSRQNHVSNFSIGTNGSEPAIIRHHLERMLNWLPETKSNVTIDLSLDGLEADHDVIRDHPGLFNKVERSVQQVKSLQKEYSGFNICIDVTVSALNHHKLRPLYVYIRDTLKPDILNALLIRGNPREEYALNVDVSKYEEMCRWIEDDTKKGAFKGYSFAPNILHVKDILLRKLIIKTATENKYQAPCTAGTLTGVIYPEGDVAHCELTDQRLGSLRDLDYDMKKVWTSPQAEQIRREIKEQKCFCIHQCFLSNNILFNPRFLPSFMKTYIQLKKG